MNRETAKRIVSENRERRRLTAHKQGGLKGKKWQGGASTDYPAAGRVKITDKDGNVRYQEPLTYAKRRDMTYGTNRGKVSHELKKKIYARDKVCQKCGTAAGPFHVDHIRPYSKGGWNVESNLQLLCAPCNRRKGATWSKRSRG